MPTDLRSTNARPSPFELEEQDRNKKTRRGITTLTVDVPGASKTQLNEAPRSRPLWRTPEFFFYYLVAAVVVPFMVWVPMNLSSRASFHRKPPIFCFIWTLILATHANYAFFHYKLSPGWLFNRQVVSIFILECLGRDATHMTGQQRRSISCLSKQHTCIILCGSLIRCTQIDIYPDCLSIHISNHGLKLFLFRLLYYLLYYTSLGYTEQAL
ncbi:hypothetical protein JVU11DRAFT_9581 [Chiua virens]|nr:hypothetical protein JVU11DRAFT_9581 [Chiua virens]